VYVSPQPADSPRAMSDSGATEGNNFPISRPRGVIFEIRGLILEDKRNIINHLKAWTRLQNWRSDCNIGHGQAKVCMDVSRRMV
jgi:hypothetical protein